MSVSGTPYRDGDLLAILLSGQRPPVLDLSARDREQYFEAVLNPPPPNEHLLAAAKRWAAIIDTPATIGPE